MLETVFWNTETKSIFIGGEEDLEYLEKFGNKDILYHKTLPEDQKPNLLELLDGYSIVDRDQFDKESCHE